MITHALTAALVLHYEEVLGYVLYALLNVVFRSALRIWVVVLLVTTGHII